MHYGDYDLDETRIIEKVAFKLQGAINCINNECYMQAEKFLDEAQGWLYECNTRGQFYASAAVRIRGSKLINALARLT